MLLGNRLQMLLGNRLLPGIYAVLLLAGCGFSSHDNSSGIPTPACSGVSGTPKTPVTPPAAAVPAEASPSYDSVVATASVKDTVSVTVGASQWGGIRERNEAILRSPR